MANALITFLTNQITVFQTAGVVTSLLELEREVVVVPEPITNKLLISASPRYYDEVRRLIIELDAEQPMVVIQVMVA